MNADEALGQAVRQLAYKINDNYIKQQNEELKTKKKVLFVDLGNIHDLLQIIDQNYKKFEDFEVIGICDLHYNGYGINYPSICCKIIKAGGSKNAADVLIVWRISRMCLQSTYAFYIVTKDKGFTEVVNLCQESGSTAFFFNSSKAFLEIIDM